MMRKHPQRINPERFSTWRTPTARSQEHRDQCENGSSRVQRRWQHRAGFRVPLRRRAAPPKLKMKGVGTQATRAFQAQSAASWVVSTLRYTSARCASSLSRLRRRRCLRCVGEAISFLQKERTSLGGFGWHSAEVGCRGSAPMAVGLYSPSVTRPLCWRHRRSSPTVARLSFKSGFRDSCPGGSLRMEPPRCFPAFAVDR
mmetsp:Transcript_31587/g.73643  ORF Transcript_31587/g.73643 Transcript_31587/m.73643 type:complete len:200 (-) Transcript_31587:709-1308(-)